MWPRRQQPKPGDGGDANARSAAPTTRTAPRVAPPHAPSSSASPSASAPVFAPRRSVGKPPNSGIKTKSAPNSTGDDAGWLLRAYDKKKAKPQAKTMAKAKASSKAEKTVKPPLQPPKKQLQGSNSRISASWQQRRQLWQRGNATNQTQSEAAALAKQQELEHQETGFDRVFHEVFGQQQDDKQAQEPDSLLGNAFPGARSSVLGPSSLEPVTKDDGSMESTSILKPKATGKRPATFKEGEEEEEWGFASSGNTALCLDDFDAPSGSFSTTNSTASDAEIARKAAEFERWKVEQGQSAVSDNFVKLNMRKRFKGSSGRAKKRPAYLRARYENPMDEATGESSSGVAPLVNASGSQQREQQKPLLAEDGVDFIEECLEALAKAENAHKSAQTGHNSTETRSKTEEKPLEPPRCHHALICQALVVKKKNKNHGRRFFACPLGFDEGRCDFFLWEEDHTPLALQTLFTASSNDSAASSAVVECVPLDLEASKKELAKSMVTNLRLVFGHAEFRAGQEWAISRVLRGKDTLLVLPTGAGKSLCYQFPALFLPGLTLVISPLISLMNDQFESLPAPLKARAVCLSGSGAASASSKAKHAAFVRDLLAEKLSLIFLSPEKALGAGMQSLLALPRVRARLALVCVDEAHCVSEWSHHFRPSYLRLAEVFRHAQCVLCVTATASRRVVRDVLRQLRSRRQQSVENPAKSDENEAEMVLQMPWQRRNLSLEVRSVRSNDERLKHLVQTLPELSKGSLTAAKAGGGVIVYVHQQRQTEELAALLREQLPGTWRAAGKVLAFHAGMTPEAKEKVRRGFASGKVRVVVATVAFGMGIDKKNVRAVVHFHSPSSVEGYVQQVGRAGRDGKPARALLYLLQEDAVLFRSLVFSTALHRDQLRRLLTLVFEGQTAGNSTKEGHVVAVKWPGKGGKALLTLVTLERDWLERAVDLKAATIETFLTLLALDTQRDDDEESKRSLRVTLQPLSMSRCTLQLLETQAKKLPPRSCVKLILEAARRGLEVPSARVTRRNDGYLSSYSVDFHLHEMAQWYTKAVSTNGSSGPSPASLVAPVDQQLTEEGVVTAAVAASERRMLQELRAAQQAGQIQRFSLSQPAFQVRVAWKTATDQASEASRREVVERWTGVLYTKHEHLETRQLARLAHLHGALHVAALPVPALRGETEEDEEGERELKARALENKLVHYFDDDEAEDDGEDMQLLQKLLRPLTLTLIESIERDARALVQLRLSSGGDGAVGDEVKAAEAEEEEEKWTSYAVAKIFHGLTTPRFPTRKWRDHVCWRKYMDVAFERLIQITNKVLLEDQEGMCDLICGHFLRWPDHYFHINVIH
ncbi:hypothetical protein BBJ28_00015935 [Nothophytophthora sp. Chile5]|nr:hypothetical protein BBJ28_00015935 [Nothophytophthora sp. Chile5]